MHDYTLDQIEEIFVVLNFHNRDRPACAYRTYHLRFLFSRRPNYPRKMRKLAPCENFPLCGIRASRDKKPSTYSLFQNDDYGREYQFHLQLYHFHLQMNLNQIVSQHQVHWEQWKARCLILMGQRQIFQHRSNTYIHVNSITHMI